MSFYKKNCSVNILGTIYKISYRDYDSEAEFKDGAAGYCNMLIKEIAICNLESMPDYRLETEEQQKAYYSELLRHEILHAFLYESGLDNETSRDKNWAVNEEMIDWFAIQSPKLFKIYTDIGVM